MNALANTINNYSNFSNMKLIFSSATEYLQIYRLNEKKNAQLWYAIKADFCEAISLDYSDVIDRIYLFFQHTLNIRTYYIIVISQSKQCIPYWKYSIDQWCN